MKKFLSRVFKEPDGKPSFSRISSAIWLAAVITWTSCIVAATHKLPDQLFGVAAVIGALYGANQVGSAIDNFTGSQKS